MTTFTLFPAIDLRSGQVVRLAQGDPNRQTTYADDPVVVAQRWQAEGATWLHVVNLDGAFGQTTSVNSAMLPRLTQLGLKVQFGGGLRDEAAVQRAFEAGVTRVVLGTAAIENPALVEWALKQYGDERVAIGIDARDGLVRVKGWLEATPLTAIELGQRLYAQGARWCIFTDVARDGLGTGVNVAATTALAEKTGLRVIASGGIKTLADVRAVQAAHLPGLIIGRALYEGHLTLASALSLIIHPS